MALLKSSHPWNPGYALPPNVLDEPLGRGTFTGQYIPRGTIDTVIPGQFQGLGSLGHHTLQGSTLAKNSLQGNSLQGTMLGSVSDMVREVAERARHRDHRDHRDRAPGFAGDPIAAYGANAAAVLMAAAARVPRDHRTPLMREMLNHIDSSLWARVSAKATEIRKSRGYDARTALQKALAICMATGFLHELDAYGKGKKKIEVRSHMGLAAYGVGDYQESLGFSLSSVTDAIGTAAKAVGSGVSTAAKATYGVGKTALKTVGNLACKASSIASNVPPITPGTMGVAAGANAVKGVCGGGKKKAPKDDRGPGGGGGGGVMAASVGGLPVMPIVLGGAALAAVYFMTRKKSA
jgi:hypothetical protein